MGLPPWVCSLWAWDLLVVGLGFACLGRWSQWIFFFFFFGAEFYLVMIFHKPHGGGWVLVVVHGCGVGFDVG